MIYLNESANVIGLRCTSRTVSEEPVRVPNNAARTGINPYEGVLSEGSHTRVSARQHFEGTLCAIARDRRNRLEFLAVCTSYP